MADWGVYDSSHQGGQKLRERSCMNMKLTRTFRIAFFIIIGCLISAQIYTAQTKTRDFDPLYAKSGSFDPVQAENEYFFIPYTPNKTKLSLRHGTMPNKSSTVSEERKDRSRTDITRESNAIQSNQTKNQHPMDQGRNTTAQSLRQKASTNETTIVGNASKEHSQSVASKAGAQQHRNNTPRSIGQANNASLASEKNKSHPEERNDGDWFDHDRWWGEMHLYSRDIAESLNRAGTFPYEVCDYVEDVCRISGQTGWVYDPNIVTGESIKERPRIQQVSNFTNHGDHFDYYDDGGDPTFFLQSGGTWNVGYFEANRTNARNPVPTCSYLPVTNHIVLMGEYTKMLGEFYDRIFAPFVELLIFLLTRSPSGRSWPAGPLEKDSPTENPRYTKSQKEMIKTLSSNYFFRHANGKNGTASSDFQTMMTRFRKESRFYLAGIGHNQKPMLESHRAFLSLISDHNAASSRRLSKLKSMIQMLHRPSEIAPKEEEDSSECVCAKRLILCGFVKPKGESDWNATPPVLGLERGGSVQMGYRAGYVQDLVHQQTHRLKYLQDATKAFWFDAKAELAFGKNTSAIQAEKTIESGDEEDSEHEKASQDNEASETERKINATIAKSLNASAVLRTVTEEEFWKEWKIVGLTQRSDRREWINHQEVMDACNEKFANLEHKLICIGIDLGSLDYRDQPKKHIAAHNRLSALMGVHGAQLTEGVFLPSNSLVVEFLPFVEEDSSWGGWTRYVHTPTPLGRIFTDSKLNHIGLPLTISSAMHIKCIADAKENDDKATFLECIDYDHDSWEFRSFTVRVEVILSILERFVVPGVPAHHKDPSTDPEVFGLKYCGDFENAAADDFVLYNVHCAPNASAPLSPHHYYRTEEWLEKKTHSSVTSLEILFGL